MASANGDGCARDRLFAGELRPPGAPFGAAGEVDDPVLNGEPQVALQRLFTPGLELIEPPERVEHRLLDQIRGIAEHAGPSRQAAMCPAAQHRDVPEQECAQRGAVAPFARPIRPVEDEGSGGTLLMESLPRGGRRMSGRMLAYLSGGSMLPPFLKRLSPGFCLLAPKKGLSEGVRSVPPAGWKSCQVMSRSGPRLSFRRSLESQCPGDTLAGAQTGRATNFRRLTKAAAISFNPDELRPYPKTLSAFSPRPRIPVSGVHGQAEGPANTRCFAGQGRIRNDSVNRSGGVPTLGDVAVTTGELTAHVDLRRRDEKRGHRRRHAHLALSYCTRVSSNIGREWLGRGGKDWRCG